MFNFLVAWKLSCNHTSSVLSSHTRCALPCKSLAPDPPLLVGVPFRKSATYISETQELVVELKPRLLQAAVPAARGPAGPAGPVDQGPRRPSKVDVATDSGDRS